MLLLKTEFCPNMLILLLNCITIGGPETDYVKSLCTYFKDRLRHQTVENNSCRNHMKQKKPHHTLKDLHRGRSYILPFNRFKNTVAVVQV